MECELPHVLIVDDEEDLCWALGKALLSIGFTVKSVNNGEDAMNYLTTHDCTIAFVDAKIPDMDGLVLASLISQLKPDTSLVLISGFYYQEDKVITEGLQENHFDGFIAKPFDLNEIRRLARQAATKAGEGKNV